MTRYRFGGGMVRKHFLPMESLNEDSMRVVVTSAAE
jgi:hypothetical protein